MKPNDSRLRNLVPQWKKGQTGNPSGTNRTAGFKHYAASLYAEILDTKVTEFGEFNGPDGAGRPFPIVALSSWMRRVLDPASDKGVAQDDFVAMLLPKLDQLDLILTNQKSQDIHYLTYLIYKYCFDEQQQVLLTQKKLIVLICGRRAGKTVLIAALLILVAISYDRGDVIYLGRTATSAMQIIWRTLMEILKFTMLPYKQNLSEQYIELNTGVRIYVKGTNTKEDIENLRGMSLRLAVKDECQGDAHGKLKMLVEEVLGPATKDFADSQILLAGSPPRIEGSYQEELYASDSPFIARYNWNMSVNPHIPNHEHILEETLEKDFAGNANDTVYLREHCGKIGVYDTEALVFRIQPGNYYQEAQFAAWINSQPITDIFLSAGVDYGFDDQDSCVIIVASERKPERFLIYEYKGNRSGITDFANQMKRGLFLVTSNPILAKVNKGFTWYCDTEGLGKKITYELAQQFGLTVAPAYQGQPEIMVEMLQDDVKTCRFKVRAPQMIDKKEVCSILEDECRKIVFARDDNDRLTRRIDDEIFHPEELKSVLYAMRYVWLRSKVKLGGASA